MYYRPTAGSCYHLGRSVRSGVFELPFDELPSSSVPSCFGAYRVLHQTGSGVLGPVFRAFDPQGDRLVVIKAFKLDLLPEQTARLAEALRRLATRAPAHPSLVALVDAGLEGTTPFLAMAHAPGETLDVMLRRASPITLDRALPILADVAAALDASWTAGQGHGALHPRDIFVTVDGRHTPSEITLTGVGLVAAFEAAGISSAARRPYAAPERVAGRAWDVRADVYSLGVIAHEMLTGRRPLGAAEQDGTFDTAASPEARVALRRVLARALGDDVQARFATAMALTDALLAVAEGDFSILQDPALAPAAALAAEERPEARQDVSDDEQVAHLVPLAGPQVVALPVAARAAEVAALASPNGAEGVPAPFPTGVPIAAASEAVLAGAVPAFIARPPAFEAGPEPRHAELMMPAVLLPAPTPARAAYPWGAMAMVLLAGVSVGVVGDHYVMRTRQPVAPPPALVVDAASPADTEVKVAPPPEAPLAADVPVAALPDARRALAATGRVLIRSTPAGATVTIDGQALGETPVSLADVAFGTHAVRVTHAGYAPYVRQITLSAATPTQSLTARLERGPGVAGYGAIDVDSRPRGARVLVDGRVVGTTPMRVPQLATGSHTVTLEKAGHRPVTTKTTVEAGRSATVRLTLARQRASTKSAGIER